MATSTSHLSHRNSIASLTASSVQSSALRNDRAQLVRDDELDAAQRGRGPSGASNPPSASTIGAVAIATTFGRASSFRFMKCRTNGVGRCTERRLPSLSST